MGGGRDLKLLDDLEQLLAAKPKTVTLQASDLQRLIDWARRTADKRRDKDTKRLRCAMYRAAGTMRAAADKLDEVREAK